MELRQLLGRGGRNDNVATYSIRRLAVVLLAGLVVTLLLCAQDVRDGFLQPALPPGHAEAFYNPDTDTFYVRQGQGRQPGGCKASQPIATALFLDLYKRTGWYRLEVSVNPEGLADNRTKARAAGFLEGVLTSQQIYNYWYNYRLNEYKKAKVPGQPPEPLKQYAVEQRQYLEAQIKAHPIDPFWHGLDLVLAQLEGLVEGYAQAALPGQNLTWVDLYLLQSVGDLYDLNVVYHDEHPNGHRYSEGHGLLGPGGPGDKLECSVLIKLVPAERANRYKDFWAAHTTWRAYYAMVRTYKVYDFPWSATGPVIMASSPGLLHSKDDWYTTDRFVVMETTNGVYNQSLYSAISPMSALSWQRVQLANFGATSALHWVELFKRENSGTYNNQWMVLDVELLAQHAQHDVLWIIEQLPGWTHQADVTQVLLQQGYWAAYNVPYFPEVYQLAGYPQPNIYSTCPRAKIFARDQASVHDRLSIRQLIRSNAYQKDPLSHGRPNNAICSRYDLPAVPVAHIHTQWTPHAFGCVDGKAINFVGLSTRATDLVSGPTNQEQAPFSWTSSGFNKSVPHNGLVDEFDFPWVVWQPRLVGSRSKLRWQVEM